MILSTDGVWAISKNHLKVLEVVEDCVLHNQKSTAEVLKNKSKVQTINCYLQDLINLRFLKYDAPNYKLTISGFDCLAIKSLRKTGLERLGTKIGVGKESDIYEGVYKNMKVALKFHRLGRTSFRTVRNNRDYCKGKVDWCKVNKVSCHREVQYYELFKDLEVPKYLTYNRHVIIIELLDYSSLYMTKVVNPNVIYTKMINFIRDLWHLGYAHGDFNEFNVMVKGDDIKVLDFPQCVANTHKQAIEYLRRDVECTKKYFERKYGLLCEHDIVQEIITDKQDSIEIAG